MQHFEYSSLYHPGLSLVKVVACHGVFILYFCLMDRRIRSYVLGGAFGVLVEHGRVYVSVCRSIEVDVSCVCVGAVLW